MGTQDDIVWAEFMFKRQKDGERSLGRYRDGDTSKIGGSPYRGADCLSSVAFTTWGLQAASSSWQLPLPQALLLNTRWENLFLL